jgi:hypothetical protein
MDRHEKNLAGEEMHEEFDLNSVVTNLVKRNNNNNKAINKLFLIRSFEYLLYIFI